MDIITTAYELAVLEAETPKCELCGETAQEGDFYCQECRDFADQILADYADELVQLGY